MNFGRLRRSWPALQSQDLSLFLAGQAFSLTGTFMQRVAMGWLFYRLSHSAFVLGVAGFLGHFPTAAAALFASVLIDRVSALRVLKITQTVAMAQALLLGLLVWSNYADLTIILALACIIGLTNGFDLPARQVLLSRLVVNETDLPNAIALHSIIFDSARLVGPPIAGMLVATIGEWICFLLNAASYLPIIAVLLFIRQPNVSGRTQRLTPANIPVDGLQNLSSTPLVLDILLAVSIVAFAAAPYETLLPLVTARFFESDPYVFGLLVGAIGAGSLSAAFFVGRKRDGLKLKRMIVIGAALFGSCLILFAVSRSLVLSVPLASLAGFGITLFMASCNIVLISLCQVGQRGRVMSLFTLAYMGAAPVGSLTGGVVAVWVGEGMTIAAGGALCLVAAIAFKFRLEVFQKSSSSALEESKRNDGMAAGR
jgi:MFS family permease